MFEKSTEKGSVWVALKRSSLKSKVQRNKMKTAGQSLEYRCLVRATDGKKTISTSVGMKEHQRFQASDATILKARMTALMKRERKDKKKSAETDKKVRGAAPRPQRRKSRVALTFLITQQCSCRDFVRQNISPFHLLQYITIQSMCWWFCNVTANV